jgi:hypothetical protein
MIREVRQVSGLFLALLAILAQLTLTAAVPASVVSLADVTVLCQHDGNPNAPPAPAQQSPDCLVCFFCHNVGGAAVLVAAPPMLPGPTTTRPTRANFLPPAAAPPPYIILAAHPRGPPILV